ncbi:heterokaryon incompatibility protein-domain-containing protein [Jackrogersella minutella]|nr:heterokaryon incompatibility protein-domain-containing protein [Jackrogersella minutella]
MSVVEVHTCAHCAKLVIDMSQSRGDDFVPTAEPTPQVTLLFNQTLRDVQQAQIEGCTFFEHLLSFMLWSYELDTISAEWKGREDELLLYAKVTWDTNKWDLVVFRGIGFWNAHEGEEVCWWNTKFDVYSTKDDIASTSILTRPINTCPGSQQNLDRMREYLAACSRGDEPHRSCQKPNIGSFMPSHLLMIEESTTDSPFHVNLVPNTSACAAPYAALSYCWGGDQPHKTIKRNRVERTSSGVPWDHIPKTIQDAVTVTARLGLTYLWVDSFCIVQDDEQSKAREIALMPQVYKQADVTIVASRSTNATEGFLSDIHPDEVTSFTCKLPFRCPDGRLGSIYLVESGERTDVEPIDDRGWTLQESYLSSRLIKFGSRQSTMICQCSGKRPRIVDGWKENQMHQHDPSISFLSQQQSRSNEIGKIGGAEGNFDTLALWEKCLSMYTRRNLTVPTDRCLAISGIADQIASCIGGKYFAGIWERSLPFGLLWGVSDAQPHPSAYQGPSWSWTSVNGCIEHGESAIYHKDVRQKGLLKVLDVDIELCEPLARFGAVKHGHLRVRGRLLKARWTQAGLLLTGPHTESGHDEVVISSECELLYFNPDTTRMKFVSTMIQELNESEFATISDLESESSDRSLWASVTHTRSRFHDENRDSRDLGPEEYHDKTKVSKYLDVYLLEVCWHSGGPIGLVLVEIANEGTPVSNYRRFKRVGLFDFVRYDESQKPRRMSSDEWQKLMHRQQHCFDWAELADIQVE